MYLFVIYIFVGSCECGINLAYDAVGYIVKVFVVQELCLFEAFECMHERVCRWSNEGK